MNHFIVGQGQKKVFVVCVQHAKGQFVVMEFSMHRFPAHVAERVVHPAHVPLEAKPQPTVIGRF